MPECVKVVVPSDACYVALEGGEYRAAYSERTEHRTPGGDSVVLDFDAHHRLIGIELVGHKPCQSTHDLPKGTE